MAHLYVSPETDSIYLDVTAGDRSAAGAVEVADGVHLHFDDTRVVVAIEVMNVSRRGGVLHAPSEIGRVHVNPDADSLYLDVSAGTRVPVDSAVVADGIVVHVDEVGALVGIEVIGLRQRGGLQVDDPDAMPDDRRPAIFDDIERAAQVPHKPRGQETC